MGQRISRLLIANRGEIAVRIARACRELGIESVAVHSSPDRTALHTRIADRAIEIGPAPATASYLSIPSILEAARQSGADAIHPGYGFLSENAAFAAACAAAGLIFVGPSAAAIERMGSKIEARRLMESAGVPVVPGMVPADQSEAGIRRAIEHLGLPALIKPSAGGGGKGMRSVRDGADLDSAIAAARREALAAFADGTLYIERLLDRPRHIEIQIVADAHGNVVHLFERECSIQRRHQKIIEESPSAAVTPSLRQRMGAAAVAAARAVEYRNVGTVEFLVEGNGNDARFHFLEMNTRLQVEHPVTEQVTGVDLVQTQIAVASGAPLPWSQGELSQRGHVIECRVYAEDSQTFLPQAGRIVRYREPTGPGIRVDSGVDEGADVPVHYDPLLSKVVVTAASRERAIARAAAALRHYVILGIRTNVSFLVRVLDHERFRQGAVDTGFIDEERDRLTIERSDVMGPAIAAAVASAADTRPAEQLPDGRRSPAVEFDPWIALRGWRP